MNNVDENKTLENCHVDGAVGALCYILKLYGFTFLTTISKFYNQKEPESSIENIVKGYNILTVIANECEIIDLIELNQPVILNIGKIKNHFVVCLNYNKEEEEFLIYDPLNGRYYATVKSLDAMWSDKKCIVFIA
ncbi:cysteine peptidase family C39 domain-containing protein [Flavobacterium sp.]